MLRLIQQQGGGKEGLPKTIQHESCQQGICQF
jgi:hypothetical protein